MDLYEAQEFFHSLFAGRVDAYGDGGMNPKCVHRPVTFSVFDGHLNGIWPIGIYPITPDHGGEVKWTCVDIDEDSLALALSVHSALSRRLSGAAHCIERSRSKGFHVWSFLAEPLPAWVARRAVIAVCNSIGYSPKEVNPKQESFSVRSVGNFVRLPYPFGWEDSGRQVMIRRSGETIPFVEAMGAISDALSESLAPGSFDGMRSWHDAAATIGRPEQNERSAVADLPAVSTADVAAFVSQLPPLLREIVINGPREGHDRSRSLVRLAKLMAEAKTPLASAALALTIADSRWGKYSERGDAEERLLEILSIAYGEDA